MSLPDEQLRAQKGAFDYAMENPELWWGRHLTGPAEFKWMQDQAQCVERVNDANKWRKVAKRFLMAINESDPAKKAALIRAARAECASIDKPKKITK